MGIENGMERGYSGIKMISFSPKVFGSEPRLI